MPLTVFPWSVHCAPCTGSGPAALRHFKVSGCDNCDKPKGGEEAKSPTYTLAAEGGPENLEDDPISPNSVTDEPPPPEEG